MSSMSDTVATLLGLQAATGGMTLQDMLGRAAPGLGFLPSFIRTWLQVDISSVVGLLSLIGAMSTGFHFLNRIGLKIYWTLTRFCTATVSIAASDRLNREVLNWLSATVLLRQGTRVLNARSEAVDRDRSFYRTKSIRDDCANEKRRPVVYLPTFGTTWFWHRRNLFVVRCVRPNNRFGNDSPDEYADAPSGEEPLVVMCFGRSVEPIKKFLDDCRQWGEKQRERFVTVRTCKKTYAGAHWDTTILRPTRPLHTVHFDEQIKNGLVEDIKNYLDPQTRKFYQERGIPYRRGYLLHGPPGTGKTSLSLALASMFGLELYLLHVPSMSDDKELESMFDDLPPRCILLLEDIDAVGIQNRNDLATRLAGLDDDEDDNDDDDYSSDKEDRRSSAPKSRSSLSGLLNVLDGVASQEGRIVFMTSNLADKLDPALIRPGRIDRKIYLGNINQESSRLMFSRMYAASAGLDSDALSTAPKAETPENSASVVEKPTTPSPSLRTLDEKPNAAELEGLAADFASNIPDDTLTPALIQGFLLSHRSSPLAARDGIQAFVSLEIGKKEQARAAVQKARETRARRRKSRALAQLGKLATLAGGNDADSGSHSNASPKRDKDSGVQGDTANVAHGSATKEASRKAEEDKAPTDGAVEKVGSPRLAVNDRETEHPGSSDVNSEGNVLDSNKSVGVTGEVL